MLLFLSSSARVSLRRLLAKGITAILLSALIFSPVTAEDGVEQAQDFAAWVYEAYQMQDFAAVYSRMHPTLHEVMSLDVYESFQRENTKRYQLEILDSKVGVVRRLEEVPRPFAAYLNESTNDLLVYAVEVDYTYRFRFLGRQHEREIHKDVIVARSVGEDEFYLLWDPEVIDTEEP